MIEKLAMRVYTCVAAVMVLSLPVFLAIALDHWFLALEFLAIPLAVTMVAGEFDL